MEGHAVHPLGVVDRAGSFGPRETGPWGLPPPSLAEGGLLNRC